MPERCVCCGEIIPEGQQVCPNCRVCTGEDEDDPDPCPCDSCSCQDSCDGWEARYCCALCRWYQNDPDCDNCDPRDI